MFSTTYYDENEKFWRGFDVPPLDYQQVSLSQALFSSMSIFGSETAQISDNNGVRMSFDDIRIATIRVAQNLQTIGCKPKDVFMIIGKNSHQVAPITFASIAIGCPINALDLSFRKTEVIHMMKITQPKIVFCDCAYYELIDTCLRELGNNAQIFSIGGVVGRSQSVDNLFNETHKESFFRPVKVDVRNETAIIVCSSGTTGLPKGVCLSHAAILDSLSRYGVDFSHVMLCFSSLHWVSGVLTLMCGTLFGATRIITTEAFLPELQIRLIEQYKVTSVLNAPHQIVLMMKTDNFAKADLSSVKYLLVESDKISQIVKKEISHHLPNGAVIPCYGISETVGLISFDNSTKNDEKCVGRLCHGCCVKIMDEYGNLCGINRDGEITIKMDRKFLGYYNDPQATQEMFDAGGFISTGDIGHFDEDGDLYITGRKKDHMEFYNLIN